VGPTASLVVLKKGKSLAPTRVRIPNHPSHSLATKQTQPSISRKESLNNS
jgi:hypothetical protein